MRVGVADDVEAARITRVHLDPDIEPEVAHQLLEDLAAGRERLRRCLGCLEVGPLGSDRPACRRDLGGLIGIEV